MWNTEVRRMRSEVFPLVPVETFDRGLHDLLAPYGDVPSILNRMDRQMESMRRHTESVMDTNARQTLLGGHVNTSDHGLTVHAKKSVKDEKGARMLEYSRTIYLPLSVDKDHFQANMTEDGILTLEAPVTTKLHNAVTFNCGHQLALKPPSEAEVKQRKSTEHALGLKPIGTVEPTVIKDETTGR
ncbi:uncharacterized protein DEA37_0013833 [Paragonimus westermani]|uniref:SHSP domain-containing protein n=1 Tax=Paragonimus westermani TaxID=34504 RepID=A0A5J4P0Z6_9TREM|nr:uncharacterized protein DEA37_0013833 [Paragonimus westermani]